MMARGHLLITVLFLLLSGCASHTRHFETYAPQFAPDASSRFTVGQVIDSTRPQTRGNLPSDAFNPASELKSQLEIVLAARGLAAPANTPNVLVLIPTIAEYDSSINVPIVSPASSDTELFVKCDIVQNGTSVGMVRIRHGFAALGIISLITIGEWKGIYRDISGDIVDALQKKIGKSN